MAEELKPELSVVVLADYAAGSLETFDGLRASLEALAHQTFAGTLECLVMESARFRDRVPADLTEMLPGARVVFSPAETSFGLRNHGIREARAEIIAFLDADCVPDRDWLRALTAPFAKSNDVVAVSGRTMYGSATALERILALLSRSYVDRGVAGPNHHISGNNAAFRRDALLLHPFPESDNPFVAGLLAGSLMRDGRRLWFEPGAGVVHAFGGWSMERDISRNAGWATIAIRQTPSQARLAWLLQLGPASIPIFAAITMARSSARLLWLRRYYDVAWYELPLGFAVAAATSAMQIPGMRQALRGEGVNDTAYR